VTENHGLAQVAARVPHGVICLTSALQFHHLTTISPWRVHRMLPPGARSPHIEYPLLALVYASEQAYQAGIEEHTIEGVPVKVTSVEARVESQGESTELQWAFDSAFRFFPLMEYAELGLTLHPFDLATNKVLALVGRAVPRDWVDIIECDSRLQPFGYLFHPVDRINSLFMTGGFGSTLGGKAGPLEQFTVGGPMRLGAHGHEEYRGNAYGYAYVGALHQIARLAPYVGGKVLVFSSFEIGGAFSDFNHARYRGDVSAGIVAETLLGPISVGGSVGEGGVSRFYFALGHLY
jgi:hypothetical protein